MHFDDVIATMREGAIVRRHDQRDTFVGDDFEQKIEDGGTGLLVEGTGRLIGEQDGRPVHQSSAKGRALTFPSGELLDAVAEAMAQTCAFAQVFESCLSSLPIHPGGDCWDEAVFFESQVGDEVVKLEDETNFVAEEMELAVLSLELTIVHRDMATVGLIQTAKQMKQCAFTTARRSAEGDSPACDRLEVDTAQDGNCAFVVALPYVLSTKDDAGRRDLWFG